MKSRSIFIFRHGERCDFLLQGKSGKKEFIEKAFAGEGNFTPFDLNLPETLLNPGNNIEVFDTPLTVLGREAAKLIGHAYKTNKISFDHVFSSPSLRCVETAAGLLERNGSKKEIKVETCLYQLTKWCGDTLPSWIDPSEMEKSGLPIDLTYRQFQNELKLHEELEDYYQRTEDLMADIINRYPEGNILIVGHGGTHDACTRKLSGGERRKESEFYKLLPFSTYLANIEMRQDGDKFKLFGSPVVSLTISGIPTFNSDVFLEKGLKMEENGDQKMPSRSIFVVRHGERADFLVGGVDEFFKKAFDSEGNYVQFDLNLPEKLINPVNDKETFDTPLTVMGREAAKLIGQAYKSKGITLDHIISSPSLRCIETAAGILEGNGSAAKICVESGLYQWTLWCGDALPIWIDPIQLSKAGLPIDIDYSEVFKAGDLKLREELEEYYDRSEKLTDALINRYPDGNILLVGHGGTLEVCTRTKSGGERRPKEEYFNILKFCSYLGNIELREEGGKFKLLGSPVAPLTVSTVPTFNSQAFLWNDEELEEKAKKNEK